MLEHSEKELTVTGMIVAEEATVEADAVPAAERGISSQRNSTDYTEPADSHFATQSSFIDRSSRA
jgi:hypothetical protein